MGDLLFVLLTCEGSMARVCELEYWNGLWTGVLAWTFGLECWNGHLDWTIVNIVPPDSDSSAPMCYHSLPQESDQMFLLMVFVLLHNQQNYRG